MKNNEQLEIEEQKIDILIEHGKNQINLHNNIFDGIDKKVQWFFMLIAGTEGYLFINFILDKTIFIYYTHDFILMLVLITGIIILGIHIFILQGRVFKTGPNIYKQTKEFFKNGTVYKLKFDILGTLNSSYKHNSEALRKKSYLFKRSVFLTALYYIGIIFYFLIKTTGPKI